MCLNLPADFEQSILPLHYIIFHIKKYCQYFYSLTSFVGEESEPEFATLVLQFVFLSDGGFRFPIAQWPSANCTPSDLYHLFWEGVLKMLEIGFE